MLWSLKGRGEKHVRDGSKPEGGGGGGGGTWMAPVGRRPRVAREHIHEPAPIGVSPYWLLSVLGVARH